MHFVLTGDEGVKYLMDILLEIKEHLAKVANLFCVIENVFIFIFLL